MFSRFLAKGTPGKRPSSGPATGNKKAAPQLDSRLAESPSLEETFFVVGNPCPVGKMGFAPVTPVQRNSHDSPHNPHCRRQRAGPSKPGQDPRKRRVQD